MALIEIITDLSRVTRQLERIADILDRVFPEIVEKPSELSTEEDIHQIGDETLSPGVDNSWAEYGPRRNY